jgi:AraC-like DNA-binding protein
MLHLAGIAITFFLVFILVSKKDNSTADKILAIWLSVTGIHLFLYYIFVTKQYIHYPYLLGIEIPIPLLHGPFLFLYTSALTNQAHPKKISALHFIPFALALVTLLPFFTLSYPQKIEVYQQEGKGYELIVNSIFVAIVVSGSMYTLMSLRKLAKHRKAITEQFSFTEKINLKWLFYLILGSSIIWLLVIFSTDEYIFAAVVLYVFFIGYFGIKQVGIFSNKAPHTTEALGHLFIEPGNNSTTQVAGIAETNSPDEKTDAVQPERIKYEKSKISAADSKAIHKKLSGLMETGKYFKEPELTLSDIAQKLDVHPNTLSQVINSMEQKNFYEYINLQRVEEFKRLITLPENQKFTLLSLAYECGFNSKTSFNRNFKKATGLSPSAFLKELNISLP